MEPSEKRHILTGGMILITLGILITLNNTAGYRFWMSWPILFIVVAVGTLVQRVKDIGGWIIGVVGIIFLLKEMRHADISGLEVYLLPLLLILLGIHVLTKSREKREPWPCTRRMGESSCFRGKHKHVTIRRYRLQQFNFPFCEELKK